MIDQAPDFLNPVAPNTVCHKPGMANAMEPSWQDVDQEAPDELVCRQMHDLHSISALDAIILPSKGHGVLISADKTVV